MSQVVSNAELWSSTADSGRRRLQAGRALAVYGLAVALVSLYGLVAQAIELSGTVAEIAAERLVVGLVLGAACVVWGWRLSTDRRHGVVWFALGLVATTFVALTVQACGVCAASAGSADFLDVALLGVLLIATGLLFSKLTRLKWDAGAEGSSPAR